jgi:S1-C subfamily serine protease
MGQSSQSRWRLRQHFHSLAFAGICICLFSSQSNAQVGKNSGLWKWTPIAEHHHSIVEIHSAGGVGTGVVVEIDESKELKGGHEGYVLTAFHVVQDDKGEGEIKVRYRNGKKARKCRIVHADEHKDVALLWVWVPDGIPASPVANDPIESGDELEFAGLGGGSQLSCCIRHFSATASSPSSLEKIFADVPLLPGDSGGPVFNQEKQVVGIISGGWFWFNSGITTPSGTSIRTTWPARASNVGPLQTLISKKNEKLASTEAVNKKF